jgi:hypothetical protein
MPAIRPLPLAAAAALAALALPALAHADGPPPGPGRAGADEVTTNPFPQAPKTPATIDLGLRVGGGVRLGSGSSLPVSDRGSAMVGVSAAIVPSPLFTVGVAFEHSTLGREQGSGDVADVDLSRAIDAVWATLRLSLVHLDRFAFAVVIGPGLVWEHVDAEVIVHEGGGPTAVECTGTASVGLGLRAGLGIEAQLGAHVWFTADAQADNLRLSSDPIGTCAPGAGSVPLLGLRVGFVYRIDVSRFVR